MNSQIRTKLLPFAIAALLGAAPAMAQVTSSSISGRVLDANGQPVVGATVQIVHEPTGTTKITTTDAEGRYSAKGMRVGGPFDVTASKAGLAQGEKDNVYLQLGQESAVNLTMSPEMNVQDLGAVTVSSNALSQIFSPDNKGLSTNVSQHRMETTPQGNRAIDDIVRLDPRINVTDQGDGSFSVAGLPNRYNNIAVDGVSIGDPFGLNANGLPYQSSPISPDTIAEYNISTTNFDVSSDTIGAAVNAVTKSGTNAFHGSLYYAYRNASSMVGEAGWLDRDDPDYDYQGYDKDQTGGFTLGGPIIKDKLFFFISAERQRVTGIGANSANGLDYGLGDGPSTDNKLSPGDLQKVIDIANGLGLKPGTFGGNSAVTLEDNRYLAKLDWNISNEHRASLAYNRTEETLPEIRGNSSNSVGLSSYTDTKEVTTDNVSLALYDDWSMNFSTETKIAYQHYVQNTKIPAPQPQISVSVDGYRSPSVKLGVEQYRHYNKVDTKKATFFFAGTYYMGDHAIKGGLYYERNKIYNLFGRTEFGAYSFDTIADFASGNYYQYDLYQPNRAGGYDLNDVAAQWTYTQFSPFIQDTWQVTPNLSVRYGLRIDIPKADHNPIYNSDFEAAFGYRNNHALSGSDKVVEPRFSFNYNFDSERMMQLRGGFGLFQTVPPTVWMTNPYQNNGRTVSTYRSYDPSSAPFSADPLNQNIPTTSNTIMDVDTIAPDFRLPTVWKASLAFDRELPWMGLVASAQYLHIKANDAILYQALNIGTPSGKLPDGRNQYWVLPGVNPRDNAQSPNNGSNPDFAANSTLLSNTSGGKNDSLTLSLSKPFADGWGASISGTLNHATEVNPGNSSQASSGYAYVVRTNPNTDIATLSSRNIARSVKASVTWQHAFYGNYNTTVSAFYVGHDGLPYSWIFSGDANGDGIDYEDPVYIPTVNDALVSYGSASPEVVQQFQDFISSDDYLNSHRGQIAGRNEAHSPWVNRIDLSLQQEIPGFFEGNKGIIRLDVYNFLNLLNNDWGHVRNVGAYDTRTLVGYNGVNAQGQYEYYLPTDDDGKYQPQELETYDSGFNPTRTVSRWSAMLTLRYTF